MAVTLVSVIVAVVTGGRETLALLADRFQLRGPAWEWRDHQLDISKYIVEFKFICRALRGEAVDWP